MRANELTLRLPFPPTINHYYQPVRMGSAGVRVIVGKKGRAYRGEVLSTLLEQQGPRHIGGRESGREPIFDGRLHVTVELHPPTRAKRDLDNYLKATLDALTAANVWADDELIDRLTVRRCEVVKGGFVVVRISAANG